MEFIKTYSSFIVEGLTESAVNEKLARGLKPLLKLGSTITKKVGEDALLDLSDKFDRIDDEYAGTIASHLDMAIELMQDGYSGDATKKLKQFNKACKDVLSGKEVGSAFESEGKVNEGKGYYIKVAVRDAKKALSILDDMYRKKFDISGSDTYYFKDEDMAFDAKMDLGARDIQVTDTNIEESISEAKIMKDLEKIGGQIDYLSDADDATKKIWKKAGVNTEDDNGNHPTIILYSYVNSWPETKKLLDKSKIKYKELEDPNSAGESFIVFNESVTEAMDMNDPILVAIRARKTMLAKEKAAPKVKKISIAQYYKLMDKESDLISQMKDAAKDYEQLDSEMNQDAGQKGADWSDADANRYGGDLDKLQTKIENLAAKRQKVRDAIKNYRMS